MQDAAPGWYPDPKDPALRRWFDGRFWTDRSGESPEAPPSDPHQRRPSGLVVAGASAASAVILGLLVTAAVPVYHHQQQRAALAPLVALTCDDVAGETIQLARTEKDLDPLEAITNARLVRDGRGVLQVPEPGVEAFVMSCSGMGTRPDGSAAPLTIDLYIDHERTHLLWYTWDV